MTAKQETAEQKLLKMIEANQSATGGSPVGGGAPAGSPKAVKQAARKQTFLGALKFFNKILILVVICSVLFFAYEIKAGMEFANRDINISLDNETSSMSNASSVRLPTTQKVSFYTSALKKRDIFMPYEASATGKTDVAANNRRAADEARNLRLVGIAWLDSVDSASAMVEDKNKKVTYFLHKGEKLGNINVKTIYADSVLLGYDNEEIIIQYDKPKL